MPRFTIVIPTRARADTLVYSLRTATAQDYDGLEILVHESGDDAATSEVIRSAGDARVRHVKTIEPVSMTENWERALGCAEGEFITFLGDDDGLLPRACATAARILEDHPAELLTWRPASYYWPRHVDPASRSRMMLYLGDADVLEEHSSRVALELFYRHRIDYSELPMIYNSFVSRGAVDRASRATGSYFFGAAPDVASGIANAFFSETFLLSGRPLSCAGLSHHSTGNRMFIGDEASRRSAVAAAGIRAESPRNLRTFLGEEMLAAKQRMFPDGLPSFRWRDFLWWVLQGAQTSRAEYEAVLTEARRIARDAGVSIDDWVDPPQEDAKSAPPQGVRRAGDGLLFDVDCSEAGCANIFDVVRLLAALVPACPPTRFVRVEPPETGVGGNAETTLQFCRGGNGLLFLAHGWSEPEPWGVWSLGRTAEVIIPIVKRPRAASLRIRGRTLAHAARPPARVWLSINGVRALGIEGVVALDVDRHAFARGELVVGFEIESPRSPAQDGISGDTRRIGFGLEEITLACEFS